MQRSTPLAGPGRPAGVAAAGLYLCAIEALMDITAEDMRFIEELPEEMTPAESASRKR